MKTVVNDITMAYEEVGNGPAVVLIHGYPLCRHMWRSQVQALAAAGYRVVTCDLRGFGESGAGDGAVTMELLADDVAALLDRLGIDQAVVGGMSMGGYVLLNLLERHRERLAGALFIVTRAGADDEPTKMRRTALAGEVAGGRPEAVTEAFEGILFAGETPRRLPELVSEVKGWMAQPDPRGLVGGLLAMRDRKDYTDLLGSFDLPALVMGAEQDRAVPPEHARILLEGLPEATLCLIDGAGHMVNLERPEPFNACLLEFLQAHFPT